MYLAPQNIPRAFVLTLGNKVVFLLYFLSAVRYLLISLNKASLFSSFCTGERDGGKWAAVVLFA